MSPIQILDLTVNHPTNVMAMIIVGKHKGQFRTIQSSHQLYSQGITAIEDIPDDFSMSDNQKFEVDIWKNQKTHIEKEKLREFIGTMHFPIYYFDFETISSPIPQFPGEWTYNLFPFQYSLDIEYEDGTIHHEEFLETYYPGSENGLLGPDDRVSLFSYPGLAQTDLIYAVWANTYGKVPLMFNF